MPAVAMATARPASRTAPHGQGSVHGSPTAAKRDDVFRGENEILLDDIGHDLRKGLQIGLGKLRTNHMQGKVDVNASDEHGCSLLMAAAHGGMLDAVTDLLARGARVNQEDDNGNTALHLSVLFDHPAVSAFLLEQGADPEHRNHHGDRPGELLRERFYGKAFAAIKSGETKTVLRLVGRLFIPTDLKEEECDISNVTFVPRRFQQRCSKVGTLYYELEEETPEDFAREHQHDPEEEDAPSGAMPGAPMEASGPRDEAAENEVASMPMDRPQGVGENEANETAQREKEACSITGRTLLMYAAEKGYAKLVKVLVRSRANILLRDSRGDNALSLAKSSKHFDIARYLNERIPEEERTEIMTEETVELNDLRKSFDAFCLLGSANIGAGEKKGGRASTMDFAEFMKYLADKGLAGPGNPCSKDMASAIFQWQMDVSTASGELEWPNFKQCLHRLAHQLNLKVIENVPVDDLVDHNPVSDARSDILKIPLTKVSRKNLQRELEAMQRSLDTIGERCKETTSCRYAAYGFGVTTGRHKLRNETFDVYRKLLRAPAIHMKMPKFTKDKDVMKKEMLAKHFFNLIDKDRSGSLTRYELQWALEDFGFTKDEQAEVFQMVDADNSGSVTLGEFLAGMGEGTVTFAGRESKSNKKKSFLEIGLKMSKAVNQKEQPTKILSISPGLFGQIFKIFCEHSMKGRLYNFKEASCLFAAPKMSALMPEKKIVKKQIVGINTRFAVTNPFDHRVLANSGPVNLADMISFDSPRTGMGTPKSAGVMSPRSASSRSPRSNTKSPNISPAPSSNSPKVLKISASVDQQERPRKRDGSHEVESSNLCRRTRDETRAMTTPGMTLSGGSKKSIAERRHEKKKKHSHSIQTFEENVKSGNESAPADGGSTRSASVCSHRESADSLRLGTPVQAGSQRSASAIGMIPSLRHRRLERLKTPAVHESPDGSLTSEHTRITLIPHRLTLTHSGQVLVGGAETTDPSTVTSIAALAVQKHRITKSGIGILNRLVFHSISFGAGHCAAVTDTGLVYTWGQGRYGQLGHGDEIDQIVPQPVRGINGKVKAVSSSFYHNVAVTVNGHLFSWGDGKEGKLGHNDNAGRLLPCLVSAFVDRGLQIVAAQAGGSHSIALSSYNQVYTFGSGGNGRLGHGNDVDQWVPTMVSSLELYTVVSLAAGFAHSVALTDDGQIFTWGSGKLGRLGHGSDSDEVLPRKVALFSHSTIQPLSVAAGEAHTAVLRSDGSMVTVGRVTHGRFAEGACVGAMIKELRSGIEIQNAEDWHHFPC